jgi:hypothetical protein
LAVERPSLLDHPKVKAADAGTGKPARRKLKLGKGTVAVSTEV